MKLRVVSDCHIDYRPSVMDSIVRKICKNAEGVEVLVVAGDLCETSSKEGNTFRFAIKHFTEAFPTVLFVPGNHEYYGSSFEVTDAFIRSVMVDYPTFINLREVPFAEVAGQRFVGDTLWFDPATPLALTKQYALNDFECIEKFAAEIKQRGPAARKRLVSLVQKGDIVVTHHAPAVEVVRWLPHDSDITRAYYVHDCESLISHRKPRAWFHGHTHHRIFATSRANAGTLFYCNPLGYSGVQNTGGHPYANLYLTEEGAHVD